MSLLHTVQSTWNKLVRSGQDVVILLDAPNTHVAVAFIGRARLSFNTDKKATIALPAGTHVLAWGVEGQPGAEYKVEILSPEKSKWKPPKTPKIDSDGSAGGAHTFIVHTKA